MPTEVAVRASKSTRLCAGSRPRCRSRALRLDHTERHRNGHDGQDEVRQSIFEPFFTTKKVGKGAGLGLATAYGIVRQSGGWIDVQSRPGTRIVIYIYLPRIDAGVIAVDAEATPQDDLRGGETVEDDDGVRELTTTILRARGYNVLEAASGLEACEVAKQHPDSIHLLLTDVIMPGMNGRELSRLLLDQRPQLKVLVCLDMRE